jgi:hypothetical protein
MTGNVNAIDASASARTKPKTIGHISSTRCTSDFIHAQSLAPTPLEGQPSWLLNPACSILILVQPCDRVTLGCMDNELSFEPVEFVLFNRALLQYFSHVALVAPCKIEYNYISSSITPPLCSSLLLYHFSIRPIRLLPNIRVHAYVLEAGFAVN